MNWKELAQKYNLDASANFWARDEKTIEAEYNGIGPDNFFPATINSFLVKYLGQSAVDKLNAMLRDALDGLLDIFQPAAVIHDDRFSDSDKTEAGFHVANEELLSNCKKIVNYLFPAWKFWLWKKRGAALAAAEAMYEACEKCGWDAWIS